MRELAGKTAFVTGGASGIGFALGAAFAQAGMKVMLADIETGALAAAVKSLHDFGPNIRGVACDVADPISVERAAKASHEAFGNVHVVCNNAGVAAAGGIDNISLDNWRWVLDVNLMGVLHRIRIGESGRNRPERYGATQTPDPASPAGLLLAQLAESLQSGLDPSDVAARVLTAIRDEELYVFTHPEMRGEVEDRFA